MLQMDTIYFILLLKNEESKAIKESWFQGILTAFPLLSSEQT